MSKYIIDITLDNIKKVVAMGVTKGGAIWTDTTDIENLEELNSDYINEHYGELQDTAYKKGLHDGESKCRYCNEYQRGFEDGKAVNNKGCDGCKYQANRELTCPCSECANNFKNQWTAKQTDDEIKVGDEVEISQSDENGVWVVIKVEKHDDYKAYCAINKDGDIYFEEEQDRVTKTGRHFDIAKILEDMRHD